LQTIVDNLYERDFEAKVMDDITISLGNDILDIVINGLEKESYRTALHSITLTVVLFIAYRLLTARTLTLMTPTLRFMAMPQRL